MDTIVIRKKRSHDLRLAIFLLILSIIFRYVTVLVIEDLGSIELNHNNIITISVVALADVILLYYIITRLYQFIKKVPVIVITEEGIRDFYVPAQFVCFFGSSKFPF
jgi:hypothetical protein